MKFKHIEYPTNKKIILSFHKTRMSYASMCISEQVKLLDAIKNTNKEINKTRKNIREITLLQNSSPNVAEQTAKQIASLSEQYAMIVHLENQRDSLTKELRIMENEQFRELSFAERQVFDLKKQVADLTRIVAEQTAKQIASSPEQYALCHLRS